MMSETSDMVILRNIALGFMLVIFYPLSINFGVDYLMALEGNYATAAQFFVNLILGVLALGLGACIIHKSAVSGRPQSSMLNIVGISLFMGGILTIAIDGFLIHWSEWSPALKCGATLLGLFVTLVLCLVCARAKNQ